MERKTLTLRITVVLVAMACMLSPADADIFKKMYKEKVEKPLNLKDRERELR